MRKYELFFNKIAEHLDLTETEFNAVKNSYEALGKYLVDSKYLVHYKADVFPQGSVRLGTVIKPLKRDDYDIDLVCKLTNDDQELSPKEVKGLVGAALKFGTYNNQLEEEHGRCWTLNYKSNPPYHIDILPGSSIKNSERVKATIKNDGGGYVWLYTNPKGFAKWFLNVANNRRRLFDESRQVEPVKKYTDKTPLQRAVQLIKRHRDVYYRNNPDDGPASVIITALMGLSYNNEESIEDILRNNPITWPSYIKKINNKYSIKIPGLPDDDYADKWNGEDPDAAKRFFKWHAKLISDLDKLFAQYDLNSFLKVAKEMFLDGTIDKVLNENASIRDSLERTLNKQLPMVIEDSHPLFKHALNITERYRYVPKINIEFKIFAHIYSDETDAKQSENDIGYFDDNSPLLSKELWLRFTATIKNLKNYTVLWQVTNTGKEAKDSKEVDPLRGKFYKCERGLFRTRIEHTAYSGTHFVQAFLIDNSTNCCVRKSNILTINIGASND